MGEKEPKAINSKFNFFRNMDKRTKLIAISASIFVLVALLVTLLMSLLPRGYTITWQNYDETTLEVDRGVKRGELPTYDGVTPSRLADEQNSYSFSGWNPVISAVDKDQVYVAQFTSETNEYRVTWQNYDGTVLEEDQVLYGTIPTYDGALPIRTHAYEEDMYYEFDGWSPEVAATVGDVVYTAIFMEKPLVFTFEVASNKATITGVVDTTITSLSLPNTIVGKPVTAIASNAFSECNLLQSIVVPNSIESIGLGAFNGCSAMETMTLPFVGANRDASEGESVFGYIFGTQAFDNASLVIHANYSDARNYYIPDSLREIIITDATDIEYGAFSNMLHLSFATISNSVETIAEKAFGGCPQLESLALPFIGQSRSATGYSALFGHIFGFSYYVGAVSTMQNSSQGGGEYWLPATFEEVSITDATSIGYGAFSGCTKLAGIHVEGTATSTSMYSFLNCSSLTDLSLPTTVTAIGDYSFMGCSKLSTLDNVLDNVTTLGVFAFSNCSSLSSVDLSEALTEIGMFGFSSCAALTSIIIPEAVATIGENAFLSCDALTIYCRVDAKPAGWSGNWNPNSCPVIWGYH